MILVTGATGFIGQHLLAWLADQQYPICALLHPSRRERNLAAGVSMQIVTGDVSDPAVLRLAMHQVTTVFHLAGIQTETPQQTFEAINVQGAHNVIEAMHEAGVRRLITVSPIGADEHSAYPYLRSKGQADELVRCSGLDYTIVRSSAVYGAGDNWTETIALALRRLPFFPIPGDGRSRLQPLSVYDLVACLDACLNNESTINETFTIGGPQQLTFQDLVTLIGETIRHRRSIRYLRAPSALRLAGLLRSFLKGRWLYTPTDLDLLSIDRTTTMDSVAYQFNFTPSRLSNSLDYLMPVPRRAR
jgi:NADH dehydrogenase